jgi:16S rRNA (guanine527-N7)-methyltransferase
MGAMATFEAWDPLGGLSKDQRERLQTYERLLAVANRKRNLVSKASAKEIHVRHIVHSLAIAIRAFPAGSTIVDWGTGGGLPGIPLAIRFPEATFHLVDSTYKKAWTVEQFKSELGLSNVVVHQMRAEDWSLPVDYAVSRATASLATLWSWTAPNLVPDTRGPDSGDWRNGLIALKGGDLRVEIEELKAADSSLQLDEIDLEQAIKAPAMADKWLIHLSQGR